MCGFRWSEDPSDSSGNLESLLRQQEGFHHQLTVGQRPEHNPKRHLKESMGGDSKARVKAPMARVEALLSSPEKGAFTAPRPKIGDGLLVSPRLRHKKQRRCRGTRPGMPLEI